MKVLTDCRIEARLSVTTSPASRGCLKSKRMGHRCHAELVSASVFGCFQTPKQVRGDSCDLLG